jgi:four helix bundle protein
MNQVVLNYIFMNAEMLKNRTKKFAIEIAKYCEGLPYKISLTMYSKQLIRCSSSVGANYRSACRAKSLADFINKLKIVEEETDESIYFMELIDELYPSNRSVLPSLATINNGCINKYRTEEGISTSNLKSTF